MRTTGRGPLARDEGRASRQEHAVRRPASQSQPPSASKRPAAILEANGEKIIAALAKAGIEFLDEDGDGPGCCPPKAAAATFVRNARADRDGAGNERPSRTL